MQNSNVVNLQFKNEKNEKEHLDKKMKDEIYTRLKSLK